MKNAYGILMFLSCILISTESFSQSGEKRYYYAYDEKNPLIEIESKLIISFQKNNGSEIKAFINEDKTEWKNDSVAECCLFPN
jgi:hypothetical protein